MKKRIILASSSPRRRELLKKITEEFDVVVSNFDENSFEYVDVYDYVKKCSLYKAKEIAKRAEYKEACIIGADTIVSFNNTILQKPKDREDAKAMLRKISGKDVDIITGYTVIINDKLYNDSRNILTKMAVMTEQEIEEYIATGEPMDRAGAFAIQDLGMKYIERTEGDFPAAIGLPVREIYKILRGNNVI